MRTLDMTPYRPFRCMGQTCQTRLIREKQVFWVKPESELLLEGRFIGRALARPDIEAAAELWRQAYPEVYGSEHDFILYPEDYESQLALAETWERDTREKKFCMLVAEEAASGRLAAATLMTKYDKNLQIEYTFAGSHPGYRHLGLARSLVEIMERMARASGAEYLTTFLETWHTISQEATLDWRTGWRIAGIFPGNFTRWAGDQQEYRACEIYLYRFIKDGEKFATQPEEWQLFPAVRMLWEALEAVNAKIGQRF